MSDPATETPETPENPETRETPENLKNPALNQYECNACGYVYEPSKGSSSGNIPPGTAFEEIPQGWRCPVCSAPRSQFRDIGAEDGASGFKENFGYGFGVNRMTSQQKNLLIFGGLIVGFIFFLSLYGLK